MKDVKITRASWQCTVCGETLEAIDRHPSVLRWIEHEKDLDQGESPIENGAGGPSRVDICPICWAKDHSLDYLCYWLARRKPPKVTEKKDKKSRNAFLRELFYHYYNNEHRPSESSSIFESDDRPNCHEEKASEETASGDNDSGDNTEPSSEPIEEPLSEADLDAQRDNYTFLLAHLLMRFKTFRWVAALAEEDGARQLNFEDAATGETLTVADLDPADPGLTAVHAELMALLTE